MGVSSEQYFTLIASLEEYLSCKSNSSIANCESALNSIIASFGSRPCPIPLPNGLVERFLPDDPLLMKLHLLQDQIRQYEQNYFVQSAPFYDWQVSYPSACLDEFVSRYLPPLKRKYSFCSSRISAVGSCFARNIVNPLQKRGAKVHVHPHGEAQNSPLLNAEIFSMPYSISTSDNALRATPQTPQQISITDYWRRQRESDLASGNPPTTMEEEAGIFMMHLIFSQLVIVTLGTSAGVFVDSPEGEKVWTPYNWDVNNGNAYHSFFSEDELVSSLGRMVDSFKASNPEILIVFTISPIPLRGLLRRPDSTLIQSPIELDFLSKSKLRLALHSFLSSSPENVHYFPSLEIIRSLGPTFKNSDYFWSDPRHPSDELISLVMDVFMNHYFE